MLSFLITFKFSKFLQCQILTFEQCSTVYTTKKRKYKKENKRKGNVMLLKEVEQLH